MIDKKAIVEAVLDKLRGNFGDRPVLIMEILQAANHFALIDERDKYKDLLEEIVHHTQCEKRAYLQGLKYGLLGDYLDMKRLEESMEPCNCIKCLAKQALGVE